VQGQESAKRAREFIGAGSVANNLEEAVEDADIVLLTVPDDFIKAVCVEICKSADFRKGSVILHFSGNYNSKILMPAKSRGAFIGSVHPARSFADPLIAYRNFAGTFCIYEGDGYACKVICRMIKRVGGIPVHLPGGNKCLYHSAAVFCSNYVVGVLYASLKLFLEAGIKKKVAEGLVLSLAGGTYKNICEKGVIDALTGPVERGDVKTVKAHLREIKKRCSEFFEVYKNLAKVVLTIAVEKGSIPHGLEIQMRKMLKYK
jgi:predicted short-subunit dehydrogenase-like oxidoreductase (DUF2520 family)